MDLFATRSQSILFVVQSSKYTLISGAPPPGILIPGAPIPLDFNFCGDA